MGVAESPGRWTGGARRRPSSTVRAGGRGTELRMGVPWCLWGAEQGRVRHTACRGLGGPLTAVGAGCGVGWGREGWVGVGGREEGVSRGKRSGPEGSGMQSEQCYRQWCKVRKGGGGWWARRGWGPSLGVASVVRWYRAWVAAGCGVRQVGGRWEDGGRPVPGAGFGGGVGWAGGGQKNSRQALEARRLRHAERTVLPAVAQSKKGGGGGWWAWRGRGLSLGAAYVARW